MVRGLAAPQDVMQFINVAADGISETVDYAKAMHDTSKLANQHVSILAVRQRVRLRGLKKRIELNSKYGVVATVPTDDAGRCGVLIEVVIDDPATGINPGGQSLMMTQDPMGIKRANLEVAPPRLPHNVLCASTYGRLDEVISYLDSGGDIEALHALHNDTLLMNSVNTPHLDIVAELLRRGANVNGIGKGGTTALHMAAWGGRKGSVKLLLEARARTDLRSDKGLVAAEEAQQQGHTDIAEMLRGQPS